MLARKPMRWRSVCEVIDVAALRDETLIVGMATLLAVTGLGVTLVPASMGNVQFGRPSDDRTFEIATDPKRPDDKSNGYGGFVN